MLSLISPISNLPGVGEKTAQKLEQLGIVTIKDILYHIPFRYDDFTNRATIAQAQPGELVSIAAEVSSITTFRTRRGQTVVKATIQDESGKMDASWFNQLYLMTTLHKGTRKIFSGKVMIYANRKTLTNPSLEDIKDEGQLHSGRQVPIYPETAEITSRILRTMIARALSELPTIPDALLQDILKHYHLPSLDLTLRMLHFPKEHNDDLELYKKRLAFEEVYLLLKEAKERKEVLQLMKVPTRLTITTQQRHAFEHALPFTLSPSQTQALFDVSLDLSQSYPSDRLIQGEVGSGKTMVAAFALYCAAINNTQSIFVAPTQIVAQQHYQTLTSLFQKLHIPIQLVTAQTKEIIYESNTIYVGTHALFEKTKKITPTVVVFDEEHRFGVEQRETFWHKTKKPHRITMTATPIPRTIAHTVFADKEVSYLDEIPEKKKQVTTKIVTQDNRQKAYDWIAQQIDQHHTQVFIVCPFIQTSEKETLSSIKAAEGEFTHIQKIFPHHHIALLHGKTPKPERDKTFEHMRKNAIDILVATPIIEVGIDIPNASIIVIEGAERFGLAQLHQLRGRVGRAGQKAYCFLFTSEGMQTTRRLKFLETHSNGNELAEMDLKLRGTGEFFGTQQHGWGTLKFASWFDKTLIEECRQAVSLFR